MAMLDKEFAVMDNELFDNLFEEEFREEFIIKAEKARVRSSWVLTDRMRKRVAAAPKIPLSVFKSDPDAMTESYGPPAEEEVFIKDPKDDGCTNLKKWWAFRQVKGKAKLKKREDARSAGRKRVKPAGGWPKKKALSKSAEQAKKAAQRLKLTPAKRAQQNADRRLVYLTTISKPREEKVDSKGVKKEDAKRKRADTLCRKKEGMRQVRIKAWKAYSVPSEANNMTLKWR